MPTYSINPFIPAILFVILAALMTVFFFLNKDQKKISLKMFMIYTACSLVAFALAGLIGFAKVENALSYFMLLQFVFLLLGVGHCVALYYLNSDSQRTSFWYEFIFSLYVIMLGVMVFYVVFSMLNKSIYSQYFLAGFIFFIVPFFVMKSFDYLLAVPDDEYTKWYYPLDKQFEDVDDEDLDARFLLVLGYKLERAEGSNDFFIPTYKSPLRAFVGDHFARFLYDYNDSYPGKKIQYLDEFGQPQGWNFYIEPKKWYQSPIYIDPNLTFNENDVREKDTIVCERVK